MISRWASVHASFRSGQHPLTRIRYAHMNNSIYNFLYDSVVNTYLIQHCGLRPTDGEQYGLVGKADHAPATDLSYSVHGMLCLV